MKAAIVHSVGQIPVYDDYPSPVALPGQHLVRVKASAISHFTRGRAVGKHLSSAKSFPFVAGYDGVGVTEGGQRVYFAFPEPPYGAMAELVPLEPQHCVLLPDDVDDVAAAALANPGMSSWIALRERAVLQPGETVLVNGATGIAGGLAVQIARHMGAGRVIVTGRNPKTLVWLLAHGADQAISLTTGEVEQRDAFDAVFAGGVDVVLDYLWGPSARLILESSTKITDEARPMRFVQIGSMAGSELSLPAGLLRLRANILMGSPGGSLRMEKVFAAIRDMLVSSGKVGFRVETESVDLSDITNAWTRDSGQRRLVICL